MPNNVAPLYTGTKIVDKNGGVTDYFRFRWEEIRALATQTPTVAALTFLAQTAAIITTTLFITTSGGLHRVNYALMRILDDGVASSLTVTIAWTYKGSAKSFVASALTEGAGISEQSLSKPITADANSAITIALAYASTTPAKAMFDWFADAEQMAA